MGGTEMEAGQAFREYFQVPDYLIKRFDMKGIDDKQLEEWSKLAEEASPGPWELVGNSWDVTSVYAPDERTIFTTESQEGDYDEDKEVQPTPLHEKNAAFLAVCREAVPALIEEVKRLKSELGGCEYT